MQPFESAFNQVQDLVSNFHANKEFYLSSKYPEEHARRDFIDKFFMALGWDVNHDKQRNPFEQEVKVERPVTMHEGRKKADYAFYVQPDFQNVRFYVEAKKPSIDIENRESYFQAVRYGWNGRTPITVLTDFEQLHILDSRIKPDIETILSHGIEKFYYTEYTDAERFAQLYYLFSREAVADNSLEKFAEQHLSKVVAKTWQRSLFSGGFQKIDESFLRDLDDYRGILARSFKESNPALTGDDLTEATQRVLDRLVFIRFLEDKSIEPERIIPTFGSRHTAWTDFKAECRRLNVTYNGIVFKDHFVDSPNFMVDDRTFSAIIQSLSSDVSPYLFNTIPIHILGNIYERFLGTIIVADDHTATIEQKPEVRKAGGVYYTPEYVVRYIIDNTVGKLIEKKTPSEISKLKFADIACGSGSFLLGVYDLLLRHHTAYYNKRPREAKRAGCDKRDDGWHLTLLQRREILLNNIYGVDIDMQAVEVAQISLYLKLLEDETMVTAHDSQRILHGALLPSLNNNIVWGNSLIGWDILADEAMEKIINPMFFNDVFSSIMKSGGFDAIVGNPPYFNVDDTWGKKDIRQKYLKEKYQHVYNDKTDIYYYFLAKATQYCKGELGFIVSRAFLEAYKADKLRGWLAANSQIREIIDFRNYFVFEGVGITTAILTLSKNSDGKDAVAYQSLTDKKQLTDLHLHKNDTELFSSLRVKQENLGAGIWSFVGTEASRINAKIDAVGQPLGKVLIIGQGMQTGRNDVFGKISQSQIETWDLKPNQYFIRARNSDIYPYHVLHSGEYLLYIEDVDNFADLPKPLQQYLLQHEAELKDRAAYRRGNCDWWKFTWPLHKQYMKRNKLFCPYLSTHNRFALDNDRRFLSLTDTTVLYDNDQPESLYYLLGLLNSKLLTFRFRSIGKLKGHGIFEYFWNSLSNMPIRRINWKHKADVTRHDLMTTLSSNVVTAARQLAEALSDREQVLYQRKFVSLQRQIDQVAYELYGLSDSDIETIETSVSQYQHTSGRRIKMPELTLDF